MLNNSCCLVLVSVVIMGIVCFAGAVEPNSIMEQLRYVDKNTLQLSVRFKVSVTFLSQLKCFGTAPFPCLLLHGNQIVINS